MYSQTTEDRAYFTVEQANAMVPQLEEAFGRILQMRSQIQTIQARLEAYDTPVTEDWEGMEMLEPGPPLEEVADRGMLEGLLGAIEEEVEALQAQGALIKGLEPPLVDWYAQRNGQEVFLCWKFGEEQVGWWHGLRDGYQGRRPIEEF